VDAIGRNIDKWAHVARHTEEQAEQNSMAIPSIAFRSQRKPYALLGVISPWNFPLLLSLIDALPALIAGCAVIIKPSEVTPRFAEPMRKVIDQVPGLKDLLIYIDGDGSSGAALIDHVDMVCFTGSVRTGRKVGEAAARNFIPACLELGGNDPALVLADADVDRASSALVRGSVAATGQACQSIERIYVAQSLYDEFVEKLVEKAKSVQLNTPDIHTGHIGPIIFEKQADILKDQLDDAVTKGAVIHCGGEIERHEGGLWLKPTVITNVNHGMKLMSQETFGPIMPVMAFEDDQQAIDYANDTEFGLSGAVFSENKNHAVEVGSQIEAGGISINDACMTAFISEAEKNSFKLSGIGASRMGPEGYTRFFRKQAIITNTADAFDVSMLDEAHSKP